MKLIISIIIILLGPISFLFGFHPKDEFQFKNNEMPEIRLYASGNIILEYNLFEIPAIAIINDSDEDIYVLWNNFTIYNMFSSLKDTLLKNQIITNQIVLYDSTIKSKQVNIEYVDSTIEYYPFLIKFQSNKKYKIKERLRGFSFSFINEDITNSLESLVNKNIMFGVTLNYIKASDVKEINRLLGFDITKHSILPTNTTLSSHLTFNGTNGFLECFETEKLEIDPIKLNSILKKYIKQVETDEYISIWEKDIRNE
ncbi:MAG: hypothetical protein CVV25_06970 [Ignavibacteriae bacterium HGW-Ignavibacteriae-4]|jgi:hypothetical protein|nr:MAG: hypothetical protein CVV25_06970 [Ignavibacteriae bacterium HGW-Ignavibacteriae-4]